MAVPKKKISKSRRGQRRAHDSVLSGTYQECQDTGELKLRHHVSPGGYYRGRQVVKPSTAAAEE